MIVKFLMMKEKLRSQENGNLQMEVVLVIMHECLLSHFSHVRLFVTLWTVACQASLSMGFSRQEYWSRLPMPWIEPASPALQVDS